MFQNPEGYTQQTASPPGQSLSASSTSFALQQAGYTVATWNRTARAGIDAVGSFPADMTADVWLLCVDDGAITEVAAQLATRADAPGKTVLHCAGRLGREALSSLADVGCITGSVHPLQSLRGRGDRLAGTYFAVEGDPLALTRGQEMVEAVGGHFVSLPEGGKAAYHAAAVLSATSLMKR